jgi:hypothetical protein
MKLTQIEAYIFFLVGSSIEVIVLWIVILKRWQLLEMTITVTTSLEIILDLLGIGKSLRWDLKLIQNVEKSYEER